MKKTVSTLWGIVGIAAGLAGLVCLFGESESILLTVATKPLGAGLLALGLGLMQDPARTFGKIKAFINF